MAAPTGGAGFARRSLDRLDHGAAFAITAALVAVAMVITLLADPRGDGPPRWAPLTIAVALSALGFGWRTGLFATALGTSMTVAAWLSPFPHTSLHRDPVGLLLFVAGGVVVTITAQLFVSARRQAQHVQERLRSVIDSAPALIWMADPRGRVTWVNREWLAFTGFDESDTSEPDWLERVHPEDREACLATYRHSLAAREAFELEHRLQRRDGEYRWFFNRGVPVLTEAGHFTGMVGSCIDVHERREAERERERLLASERAARQDAERANRTKEEFLNIVSHELRAPLNAIVGWTYVLREQLGNTGEGSRAAAVIERNARAQSRLVDDLIDMSRLLSGKLRFERTLVDLGEVAQRAVDAVQPAASEEDLAVSIDLPEASPRALGDPRRLEQVLQNLLSNAMKFTPAGGRVSLGVRSDGRTAIITVEDTGHGIASEFLPHVFDRFRQADASSTRRHGGLGIGLALVRAIVEHHGGTVSAASEGPGRGSTFTVALPLASPPERISTTSGPASRRAAAASNLTGLRVMVVDDDEDTCELLRRLLQQFGAQVRTSTSVTDALAAWDMERPDVLVSDISMPEQDGYALVRQIRRKPFESGGSVPAIALTALARAEDQRTALDAGFQMHLRKPVEPFDLVNAIHSLASRGSAPN